MFFKKKFDSISVTELNNMLNEKVNLIDVREINEYRIRHIKKAKNIPMMTLMQSANKFLKKEEKYYMVCQSGARSAKVCGVLSDQGFDVTNIKGGTGMFGMMHSANLA